MNSTVAKAENNDQQGTSAMTPVANSTPASGTPPVLPPRLSPSRKRATLTPAAIASICIASAALVLAAGIVGPRLLAQARASESREAMSDPGLTYTNVRVASVPWSIHVLKIDRSRKDLTFFAAHAKDKVLGVSLIADQARAVPREIGRAIAGVNGDFYLRDNPTYAGDPRGLQILNGELISAPSTV